MNLRYALSIFFCLMILVSYNSIAQKDKYSKGQIKKDQKVGVWHFFDGYGNLDYSYDFDNDKVVNYARKPDTVGLLVNLNGEWKKVQVERPPLYKGGIGGMQRHFVSTLRYPHKAVIENLTGIVKVAFLVDTLGIASNYRIKQSLSPECDQEAIKVISSLPEKWVPANLKQQKVECEYIFPVTFKLSGMK